MANTYFQVTANTTSSNLSSLGISVPNWATVMLVTVETANVTVRYLTDGRSLPNTSFGFPIPTSNPWPIETAKAISNTNIIATNTAVLSIEFRRSLNV